MKSWWGIASLLVVLAVVGVATTRQLRSMGPLGTAAGTSAVSSSAAAPPAVERAQAMQRQISDDVARALAQGAASRAGAADAP